ncbi:TPA: hypothetical protein N0F65_002299 [Lagenidium giganteum]|uniref:Helitron helicase-like domain-containing protein n=1 Tax=Lagenidium giganteum TaxID=4803 RepID=A0AAV2Z515_9STRA|nr:TPA: hypothetical protein N0F65_002299 [Lagenidium giganteum]
MLPLSFTGGPRHLQKLYQNAMAIVRKLGKPALFITMTCNPNWPEIQAALLPGQRAQDRPGRCAGVFRLKLKRVMEVMIEKKILGHVKARVAVVEFKKRGLPHAHTLWILDNHNKPRDVADLNAFVNHIMLHGPCGDHNPNAPCMREGVCSKRYPRPFANSTTVGSDGYPNYRRRDNGTTFVKGNFVFDN